MASPQDYPPSDQPSAASPPSLLQILWTRKALIILGAVVGVTIGAIYYVQRKPVYESTAQVLVEKRLPEVPVPGYESYGFFDDYLATQIIILSSPIIVGKAVREHELVNLPSFQGLNEQAVIDSIRGSLKVMREAQLNGTTGPSTLTLTYRGASPDDCKDVLSAVVKSYKTFLDERYSKKDQETTVKLMYTIEKKIDPVLTDLYEKRGKLLREAPVTISKDGVTLQEDELASIQKRRSELAIHAKELESRIQMIETEIAKGGDPSLLIEATETKAIDKFASPLTAAGSEANIEVQLMQQIVELQVLEARYGSGYPEAKALRNKIDKQREILKNSNSGSRSRSASGLAPSPERDLANAAAASAGLLATPNEVGPLLAATTLHTNRSTKWEVLHYVQLLRAQLRDSRMNETALKDLADTASKEVHGMSGFRAEEASLREQIASKKQYKDALTKLLNDRATLGSGGGYEVTAIAEPGQGYQIEPKPAPIFTVALLLGLAAGIALAWIAEATDKSFRTPEEVRRRLGLAVVGHVPRITPDAEAERQHEAGALQIDPSICAFYQSKSLEAEAFRGIRTTLYFSAQNEDCKIIQVTSPNMSDGKTTLATNLAVSMAQSGKKILLIDADFRRPRLHRMFGLKARTGLASVIREEVELPDVIQTTPVPNLSLLPCGPRPNNPAELLTSPRFKEVLETLRDKYDIILIDTPPLLAVSDPSVVASQVDGVLITIRVSKNGRPSAERARDILAALGAKILGVVVNGIGHRGREGYGAAHSGFQYQYQYAYEPTDNRSYYHDEGEESHVHKNGEASPNGHSTEPSDPDAVDLGSLPTKSESARQRERGPSARRKANDRPGVVGGLKRWLRATLWH